MWMNDWVRSKHTKDCLHQTAFSTWKAQFLVPQLKFAPSPRLHPQSDHIIHTKKQVKTLHIGLSCDQLNSILQAKTQIWSHKHKCYVGLKKKKLTPHSRLSYFNHHSEYIQYSWSNTYLWEISTQLHSCTATDMSEEFLSHDVFGEYTEV